MENEIISFKTDCFSVLEIKDLLDQGQIDLDPPYQRDKTWPSKFQEDLLSSISLEFPIGHLTLVETQNGGGYICLDGKQRCTSIEDFFKNKIRPFIYYSGKKKNKKISYKELCRQAREISSPDSEQIKMAKSSLEKHKIPVVIFPWMEWLQQKDIFMKINQSQQLQTNERHYCDNFHARKIIEYFYSNSIFYLDEFLSGNVKKKQRFMHLRYTHNMLMMLYGINLSDVCMFRIYNGSCKVGESAFSLHNSLIQSGFKSSDTVNTDLLKTLKINECFDVFQQTCKSIEKILSYGPHLTKKWNINVIRDFILYIGEQIGNKSLTPSYIRSKLCEFYKAFSNYAVYLTKYQSDLCHGTSSRQYMLPRLSILHNFVLQQPIDLSVKDKDFSERDETLALLLAHNNCPICGTSLRDKNVVIDHVLPKSKSGVRIPCAICKDCNLRKSNLDMPELEKYKKYIEKYQTEFNSVIIDD